jgi:hypothetical protein
MVVLAGVGTAVLIVTLLLAVAARQHRRAIRRDEGVFACKLRTSSGAVPGLRSTFPQAAWYATWVRDVLLIRSGFALSRVRPFEVVTAGYRLYDGDPADAPRLGAYPLVLSVRLEDGARIDVAAARRDREKLMQPFIGPRAFHRWHRDPRVLEETARLVRRARRQSEERKEQELPR